MADREQILHDPGLDLLVEIEQAHRVRDRGAAVADLLRDVFLAHAKFVREPRVGLRFLDRVEVGALQIFDQRQLENFEVGRLPDDDRRFGQAGFLGRAPAAFAGDELELMSFICLTISGWMMPRWRMESISSSSASRSNSRRGWSGLGTIWTRLNELHPLAAFRLGGTQGRRRR